jgi:hypothetical protein
MVAPKDPEDTARDPPTPPRLRGQLPNPDLPGWFGKSRNFLKI